LDALNLFQTRTTAALARLEWAGLLAVSVALVLIHRGQVDWVLFAGLFVVIDVVGYLPGRIAFRRSPIGCIPRVYYVLYNAMHSLATWTAVIAAATLVWGWRWAFLAVPVHLLGDRSLFGNAVKSFGVSFEPVAHPEFARFQARYAAAGPWRGSTAPPATSQSPEVSNVHA
jgi:hypothetical protein